MAQTTELMATGMSADQARRIGTTYNGALVAGTNSQSGAAALNDVSAGIFGTASAGGFLLPTSGGRPICAYYNNSGATQTLYPTGSETINGGSSFAVTNGKSVICIPGVSGWIANLSA